MGTTAELDDEWTHDAAMEASTTAKELQIDAAELLRGLDIEGLQEELRLEVLSRDEVLASDEVVGFQREMARLQRKRSTRMSKEKMAQVLARHKEQRRQQRKELAVKRAAEAKKRPPVLERTLPLLRYRLEHERSVKIPEQAFEEWREATMQEWARAFSLNPWYTDRHQRKLTSMLAHVMRIPDSERSHLFTSVSHSK